MICVFLSSTKLSIKSIEPLHEVLVVGRYIAVLAVRKILGRGEVFLHLHVDLVPAISLKQNE